MSNPFELYGGSCIAMSGKDCVAVAYDLRLGNQGLGLANDFEKAFRFGKVFLGLTGLVTDMITLKDLFREKVNLYKMREDREIEPKTFASLVSTTLYSHRFGSYFAVPLVAGLHSKTNQPYLCSFDSIGTMSTAEDFVVSGTASDQLFGMCESLWEPNLEPDDLFETISQSFMSAVDRDPLSGWGAVVFVVTKDKVVKKLLKMRQD